MVITLERIRTTIQTMTWRRLYFVVLIILLIIAGVGAGTPLSYDEAEDVMEEVEKIIPEEPSAWDIFQNNALIAVLMLIPGFGAVLGGFALYNTGVAFSAVGTIHEIPGLILLFATALTPFFWLEFLAYSASITQGAWILIGIYRHTLKKELKRSLYILILVLGILTLGALIEMIYLT